MDNRPTSRDKRVGSGSGSVNRRGSGLGTGPVGRPRTGGGGSSSGNRPSGSGSGYGSSGGGGSKIITIIIVLAVLYFGYKFLMNGNLPTDLLGNVGNVTNALTDLTGGAGNVADEFQIGSNGAGNWHPAEADLNTSVAAGTRERYTQVYGDGKDVVTIMVYMCGTDLESKHGMATSDLQEMMKADLGSNVNVVVYTGGCKSWSNNVVSSSKNQIYQIKNGKLACLESDMGSDSMTNPATLTKFIKYCTKNFPANRNMLILWDHGGGSLTGFGYDEKNASSGSMDLSEIGDALKNAGVKYDFIGFDACLMATLENALMLTEYADYLIASEETEPGVGWYYANWLTELGNDPSMPTTSIGKRIVDDFVEVCDRRCSGQKTTLSVVDLAELANTVPGKLTSFASATSKLIQNNNYQTVADARYGTREFAQSSKIDQVDLVHLAQKLGSAEGKELAKAVLSAVKYNRTSGNMTNANGLSIYFPYKKVSKVKTAVAEYQQIGMDTEYTKCIQQFALVGNTAQSYAEESGNTNVGSPLGSLLENLIFRSGSDRAIPVESLVGSLISNSGLSASDLTGNFTQMLSGYVSSNSFDSSQLQWKKDTDGHYKISLSESQWKLIKDVELNVFVDDGEGYIDLGLDNVFEYDSKGNLIGDYDGTWLSINGQIVAYYHLDTVKERGHYSITGYVPVMINGTRAELIIIFDDARPDGYIAGARDVYKSGETQVEAKNLVELKAGDKLDFLCDYYTYDGKYKDSYYLGKTMIYSGTAKIENLAISNGKFQVTYCFTDTYQQTYWTPVLP